MSARLRRSEANHVIESLRSKGVDPFQIFLFVIFACCCHASNLVFNSSFADGSGPTSFTGDQSDGASAATGWFVYNNGPTTTTTERCFVTCPSGVPPPPPLGGSTVTTIHIVTGTKESGIYEFLLPFGTGPDFTLDSAWVYVLQGGAEIGAGHMGNFGPLPDDTTSLTDQWVHLQMTNGEIPVNEFIVYSHGGPSDFFATIAVTDPDATPIPEAGTIFIGALALGLCVLHRCRSAWSGGKQVILIE